LRHKAETPREQFPCSILVRSSQTRPTSSPGSSRGCRACRATFPFSLPRARAYLTGRPAVCCGVCCRSSDSTSPTCCGHHPREDVTRMLRGNCSRGTSAKHHPHNNM